ncbi:isopentenyl phosphate kinase-like isoform X1 [Varanus komodoensis]|uniref:isopentenyl phosphate kinase-like isoform X1 n=1 Tax=Varanus komodoensis TaxID=61221 RepID=UPI001CF7D2D0|nr:isopentenyl phosphate kinase-like isoform X1 [Varanus komodoensis]
MAVVDCILKLGGSALTQKNQRETLKVESLQRAAAIVAQLRGAGKSRCIIVHGAGSFGHFQAKEKNVASGASAGSAASDNLRQGLCLTRLSVTKLNHLVTEELVKCGVPAVGLSPFGTWKTACKNVIHAGVEAVRDILDAGYIPVLHGDCALDAEQHCCILSGDTIIEVLAKTFSPKRVVFLTDVNGIYTCPPATPGAKLVDSIAIAPDGNIKPPVLTSTLPHDTTGGVSLKLQAAVNIFSESHGAIPVLICKLDSEAAERACLTGELKEGEGTKFSFVGR